MNRKTFWDLIAEANTKKGIAARKRLLTRSLSKLPPEEMVSFWATYCNLVIEAYSYNLWGAAYHINGGCSDDGFHDFCEWLVEQGRDVYESAVRDPDTLADVPVGSDSARGEGLERAAIDAWTKKTGRTEDDFYDEAQRLPRSAWPDPGEDWDYEDDDEMFRRLPRLAALVLDPPDEDEGDE